jgi:FMN reductase
VSAADPVVAVSAGDSPASKTRALAAAAGGHLIDLLTLPAEGLLGRAPSAEVDEAVALASSATTLVVATPVYRATYAGALKAFFDRFPTDALRGTAVVLCATAGSRDHYLSLDTGGRALIASLGGWTVPTVVYGVSADFEDGVPGPSLMATLQHALAEAASVSGAR